MAVLCLLVLGTVVASFATLAAIEPAIAANQLRMAQARAVAEAGVERALWALSNPADALGIPVAFATAPAPYDGSRLVAVSAGGRAIGGFRVTVARGARHYERDITAVGWVPGETAAGPTAVQKIAVTALNARLIAKDPPAALAVGTDLRVGDTLEVDARADLSCGRKVGTLSRGETRLDGAAAILGATDDNDVPNQVVDAGDGAIPPGAADVVTHASASVLEAVTLSAADLGALRALAKARGTYVPGAASLAGDGLVPDGLVFVDAAAAPTATAPAGATSNERAPVRIDTLRAAADAAAPWSGWLVVNGELSLAGASRIRGFVYAARGIRFPAGAAGEVRGAVLSPDAGAAAAEVAGRASIVYDCEDVRTGGGKIPGRWMIKAGTYREVSGS